jgi:hypothetical protein
MNIYYHTVLKLLSSRILSNNPKIKVHRTMIICVACHCVWV